LLEECILDEIMAARKKNSKVRQMDLTPYGESQEKEKGGSREGLS